MHIVVHVADAELRGTPFAKFAMELDNRIGEGFDKREILPGKVTSVSIDGKTRTKDAREIKAMVKEMTTPDVIDGYFGNAEWNSLYGKESDAKQLVTA